MVDWLSAVKTILPHLPDIMNATGTVFSKSKSRDPEKIHLGDLQQQIAELQVAASQNTDLIKELASHLKTTVSAFEQAASVAEEKIKKAYLISFAAIGISLVAVGLALVVIMSQSR